MAIGQQEIPYNSYVGGSNTNTFSITFPTFEEASIEVYVRYIGSDAITLDNFEQANAARDLEGFYVIDVIKDVDYSLSRVGIPGVNGSLTLLDIGQDFVDSSGNLEVDYEVIIRFSTEAFQPSNFKTLGAFAPAMIEKALDRFAMNLKALGYDQDTIKAKLIELQEGLDLLSEELQEGLAALSDEIGGVQDSFGDYQYSGFSNHLGKMFVSSDLNDTLAKMLDIQYAPPSVNFTASGSGVLRERGDAVTTSTLTVNYTEMSDPVTKVEFYYNGSIVSTENSPASPEVFNWAGSFSSNKTFKVEVYDDGASNGGTPQSVPKSVNFNFVYPYYYGTGAAGADETDIKGMTKNIAASSSSKTVNFTVSAGEHFYFAYPTSYGPLTEIIDENDFNVTNIFSMRQENITGLDGTPVGYNVYESNSAAANSVSTFFIFKR